MTPLVAVIVPVRAPAPFLRDAIKSVLTQTYPNFAVVVVDDGSAGHEAIVTGVVDPRVSVLRRSVNGGPAAARNDGWRLHPTAKYVAFLDADDTWDTGKLDAQVAYLEEHADCVAVGGLMRYIASDGAVLGVAGQPVGDSDQSAIRRGELFPFQLSSVVTRRDALVEIAGFDEPLGRIGSEDLDLLARLGSYGRVAALPHALGSYRIHPGSAMATHRSRINRAARFVRRRLAARRAGGDLTWETFATTDAPTLSERRQDAVERCYRQAALWHAERRSIRALSWGLLALTIDPRYTLRRVYFQRGRRQHLWSAQAIR